MFTKFKGGSIERICDRFDCWIPPVGYGINCLTGELEKTDMIQRSTKSAEQYWERTTLPAWWKERRTMERRKQEVDDEYIDDECEKFRQQDWGRRLRGVWVKMNGAWIYLTGTHYFYLNWWKFQGKWMDYRDPNRKVFYVWDYCVEDPTSLGLIEITKRKEGKTARAGCVLYEYISRTNSKHGGIQSKTDPDADEVFAKAVIQPWKGLPDFYRPVYDVSQGDTPKNELRFFRPSVRGKMALDDSKKPEELESWIDFKPRTVEAYDGPELHRYISDEAGKLKDVSIQKRHNTVKFCSEVDGAFVGKHLYTTTVEEMEKGGGEFQKLVNDSDFNKRDANGRTKSGLYVYFLPAYETLYYDKYGMPNIAKGTQYHTNTMESLAGDETQLASYKRKNPFTIEDAFRSDGEDCLYNAFKLNERELFLSWNKQVTEFGNLFWKDGIKDSSVMWEPNPNGRWEKSWLPEEKDQNRVEKTGNLFYPRNTHQFISASDTYDHNSTEDNRNSKAASFVKRRRNPQGEDSTSRKYVFKYHARPAMAEMVYEDMILQCFFFGCQILPESNKPGIINYFTRRGYYNFMVHIPGYKEPGIPSTKDNKKEASLMVESYIEQNILKIDFIQLIQQLLKFEIGNTEKYDLAMAMLWTEYADNYRYFDQEEQKEELVEVDTLFRRY